MPDSDRPEQPPVLPWARGGSGPAADAPGTGAPGPLVTAASAIAAGLPWRGDLASDSVLRLLYLAAAASATGRLDLASERGRFELQFRRGVAEQVASDAADDALGAWLVRRGALSPEVLGRAEAMKDRFGGDLVSTLVSLDAFRPARDLALLQEHGGVLVTKAIAVEGGTAQWTPGTPAGRAGFALATRWGLLCEAVRRLGLEAVRRLLGHRARRVATRTGGRVALTELKLVPQEARAASLFDGRSSPTQLAAARPSDAVTVLRVALLLGETELLQFGALVADEAPPPTVAPRPPASRTPPPAASTTSAAPPVAAPAARPTEPAPSTAPPPPPPAAPTPAPVARISPVAAPRAPTTPPVTTAPAAPPPEVHAPPVDHEAFEAFHQKIARADHFEVLGVSRTAATAQVKAAYFQLAKRYHPDAGAPDEPPATKKLRADIFARIGEAWGVLGNDKGRADYLRALESGAQGEVDVAHIVRGEEVFRKAVLLAQGRLYAQALTTIEQAIEVNPDEAEFEVWRGWLRFLVATDRDAQRAASASGIEAALLKAPKCVAGYLFLARMARNTGDLAGAERHLKRGLAVAPDHDELTRELKFIELKRK